MKDTLYISILGLSLSLINHLKITIYELLQDKVNLVWTNLSDQKLQILLIHSDFIDSPQIKKILQQNIHILQINQNEQKLSQIIDNILYLPLTHTHPLSHWLNEAYSKIALITSPIPSKEIQHNHLSKKINYRSAEKLVDQLYKNIELSTCILKYGNEQLALIDLEQQLFYPKPRFELSTQSEYSLEAAELNDLIKFRVDIRPYHLQQGLWNFFWTYLESSDIEYSQYYKLNEWPQIMDLNQRQDLFKLSALFGQGSDINFAQEKLKLDKKYIARFLCVSHLAKILNEIPQHQARYILSSSNDNSIINHKMVSFFSRLRKKLGI